MSLASGSPEPIPTDIPPDPESGIEVAVVAYPEDTDTAVASGLLPALFAGALITESVFNYPGMGYLFYQSALNQDYPVLLGITVVVAIATVVGSLLADIAYAVLDPRVRYVSQ